MEESGKHILVIPYPAQGHMLTLLDLTYQLAIRGLTITILVTPKNLHFLDPLLAKHSSIKPLVVPFPTCPQIPQGIENFKDLPPTGEYSIHMMKSLQKLKENILKWFKFNPSPPVAIISDMFLGWTHQLACQLSIPRYVFSPSGAMALAVIYSLWSKFPRRVNVRDDNEIVSFDQIPNCPKYPWWQISPIYRAFLENEDNEEFGIIKEGFDGNLASFGLVINTFNKLEGDYVEYLKKELGHERVWSVGPLLPPDDDVLGPITRGGSSVVMADDLCSWLDTCQDGTVLYVSFGSQLVLTNRQMEAVALGLERSGVKFIWSVKGATKGHVEGEYGTIPLGFEDRVAGRGLVVKGWVPQVLILRHRAMGAFLTHCGWNSVLESIVAGVPMLAWPMSADQFSDATLLVGQLKVAIKVCDGISGIPNCDEFASIVSKFMSLSKGGERLRAKEYSEEALKAIKGGGDSYKSLDEFAIHLSQTASPLDKQIVLE
ncbi:hypothetical protein Leryth_020038 [Lithospermum erythrorhizon]|nr:hypothetical protein Leryth_020038 [Lithospermum erythrorhizon]